MTSKTRIMVVDDEPDIRESLSRHFRFLGYEVVTAEHGKAALAELEERKTDIVISDIMMPEMDGIALLKRIRADYPMAHIIMMTGYVTQENVLACMRHGADTCVFKPIDPMEELEQAVRDAENALRKWTSVLVRLKRMNRNP